MKNRRKIFFKKSGCAFLVKGLNHSYRAVGFRVANIDISARILTIEIKDRNKRIGGLRLNFWIDPDVIISSSDNIPLDLAGIKVGDIILLDFVRLRDRQLVKGIRILR